MSRSDRYQRGFTLTELLTTMAVLGVSLAVAVPSFDTLMCNNRRATAINQLVSTMHAARSEAITRRAQVTICPSSDGTSCNGSDWSEGWIYYADVVPHAIPRAVGDGDQVLGGGPGSDRVQINSGDFPIFFVYRPNGRIMVTTPAESSGQFTFCDHRGAEFARVVIVNSSGEPRLSETLANGDAPSCGS